MSTTEIAAKLAGALRMTPCRCIDVGSWPLFKAEATGKHKPKKCSRCEALELHDAHVAIVQVAGRKA